MTLTLFNHEGYTLVTEGMAANLAEQASLFPCVMDGDREACERWNLLQRLYAELEIAQHALGGPDPAPYRMGRS